MTYLHSEVLSTLVIYFFEVACCKLNEDAFKKTWVGFGVVLQLIYLAQHDFILYFKVLTTPVLTVLHTHPIEEWH
jgi:hypothetical protein